MQVRHLEADGGCGIQGMGEEMKSMPVYRCRGWMACRDCRDHQPHLRDDACQPSYIGNNHRCICIKIGTMVFKSLRGKK